MGFNLATAGRANLLRLLRLKICLPLLCRLVPAALALAAAAGCKRPPPADAAEAPAATPDPQLLAAARELAAVLDPALSAYNAGDRAALFAGFASTATPAPGDRIFTELYEGYYKAEFGKITGLRLNAQETVPDPEAGQLVYLAQCERAPLVKVSANFIRENGRPKIVQLRFEKLELTK